MASWECASVTIVVLVNTEQLYVLVSAALCWCRHSSYLCIR